MRRQLSLEPEKLRTLPLKLGTRFLYLVPQLMGLLT